MFLVAVITVLLFAWANVGYCMNGDIELSFAYVAPWTVLDKLSSLLIGYSISDFQFVVGKTPFSTLRESILTIMLYYVVILGGRRLMQSHRAFRVNQLFVLHNFCLTFISGALLALFAEQLAPALWERGFLDTICGEGGWTPSLVLLYYLNYITKYLELLDTIFLVLKKKPLTFLHTYHHGATAALCYVQLRGNTSVQWVPITLNLAVHVVMYWYYFQTARGVRVWWKQYITVLQIVQFVIDLAVVYFATYTYYAHKLAGRWLPNCGTCQGEPYAAFFGCAILTSYLFLFVGFYLTAYQQKPPKDALTRGARRYSKGEAPGMIDSRGKASDVICSARNKLVELVD